MKLAALSCSFFLALAVQIFAPAPARAQTNDCAELQRVVADTEAPAADEAAERLRVGARAAAEAGIAALHCNIADAAAPALSQQFWVPGYQSRCPALPPPPAPPRSRLSNSEFSEAVAGFNAWAETRTAVAACRNAEVQELRNDRAASIAAIMLWNRRTERQIADLSAAFERRASRAER